MEMIERMAREIKAKTLADYGMTHDEAVRYAVIFIEQFRVPTDEMLAAAYSRHLRLDTTLGRQIALDCHLAMITAALREDKETQG